MSKIEEPKELEVLNLPRLRCVEGQVFMPLFFTDGPMPKWQGATLVRPEDATDGD